MKDRERFFNNTSQQPMIPFQEPKKSKQPHQAKGKVQGQQSSFLPPIKAPSKKGLLPPIESTMTSNPIPMMEQNPVNSVNAPMYPGSGSN
mmetsp:Transcript_19071/g.29262  ORF Transcript_19071/g.29262 Transcript_19071/m.29262 type:complete len:90 (+) Transcript_19071:255-524(+)